MGLLQSDLRCSWCHRVFKGRATGGSKQAFCNDGCRRNYHAAARKLGQMLLATGGPNIEALARWLECGGQAHAIATGALAENGITFSVHAGKTVNLAGRGPSD